MGIDYIRIDFAAGGAPSEVSVKPASSAPPASNVVIDFQDLPSEYAGNAQKRLSSEYASKGVTFEDKTYGVKGGTGEGDPGNWAIHGTRGSRFLGFNGKDQYFKMSFDRAATKCTFDVICANRDRARTGTIEVIGESGQVLRSQDFTMEPSESPHTVTLDGPMRGVKVTKTDQGSAMGIDFIRIDFTAGGAPSEVRVKPAPSPPRECRVTAAYCTFPRHQLSHRPPATPNVRIRRSLKHAKTIRAHKQTRSCSVHSQAAAVGCLGRMPASWSRALVASASRPLLMQWQVRVAFATSCSAPALWRLALCANSCFHHRCRQGVRRTARVDGGHRLAGRGDTPA